MKDYIDKYFETISENFIALKNQSSSIESAISSIVSSVIKVDRIYPTSLDLANCRKFENVELHVSE